MKYFLKAKKLLTNKECFMLVAALSPYILIVLLWINAILSLMKGEPILWFEWLFLTGLTVGAIWHFTVVMSSSD